MLTTHYAGGLAKSRQGNSLYKPYWSCLQVVRRGAELDNGGSVEKVKRWGETAPTGTPDPGPVCAPALSHCARRATEFDALRGGVRQLLTNEMNSVGYFAI